MLRITCAHIPTLILVPLQSCSHFMYLYSVSKNPLNLLDLLLLSALRSLQTNSPRPEDTSQSVLHIVQERMSWRDKQAEREKKHLERDSVQFRMAQIRGPKHASF